MVIMGETGCGKTYLVKYIVKVLFKEYAEYREFIFHSGVEEEDFEEFMMDLIGDARAEQERVRQMDQKARGGAQTGDKEEERPKVFWVFFDEFNTSHLQAFVSEVMHDRVFSLGDSDSSRASDCSFPPSGEHCLPGGVQPVPAEEDQGEQRKRRLFRPPRQKERPYAQGEPDQLTHASVPLRLRLAQ